MPKLIIISGPSGAGKTSLINELLDQKDNFNPNLEVSISHTTRKPRGSEKHKKDYFFVDQSTFQKMIDQSMFLECAEVYGNFYGTSKQQVLDFLAQGKDVILEIDIQGALQVMEKIKKNEIAVDLVSIFISPPSLETLKNRLKKRATDTPQTIERRLQKVEQEFNYKNRFEHQITNSSFKQSLEELKQKFIELS